MTTTKTVKTKYPPIYRRSRSRHKFCECVTRPAKRGVARSASEMTDRLNANALLTTGDDGRLYGLSCSPSPAILNCSCLQGQPGYCCTPNYLFGGTMIGRNIDKSAVSNGVRKWLQEQAIKIALLQTQSGISGIPPWPIRSRSIIR